MGRSKKNVAAEPAVTKAKLFVCYFCDTVFDEDNLLVQHQRAKHFKCLECRTAPPCHSLAKLIAHTRLTHLQDLLKVPNAKEGRDDPKKTIWIYGMQNVPEEWLAERNLPTWLKEWRPTGLESEPVRELETKRPPVALPAPALAVTEQAPLPADPPPPPPGQVSLSEYLGGLPHAAFEQQIPPPQSEDWSEKVRAWMVARKDEELVPGSNTQSAASGINMLRMEGARQPNHTLGEMPLGIDADDQERRLANVLSAQLAAKPGLAIERSHKRDQSRSRNKSDSRGRRRRSSSRVRQNEKERNSDWSYPDWDGDQRKRLDGWPGRGWSRAGHDDDRWKDQDPGRNYATGRPYDTAREKRRSRSREPKDTRNSYERRTLSIKMGSVPSRIWLKNLLAQYGRIEVCHTGNRNNPELEPPWIRFVNDGSAEDAKKAIDAGLIFDEMGMPVRAEYKKGGKFYDQSYRNEKPEINSRDIARVERRRQHRSRSHRRRS